MNIINILIKNAGKLFPVNKKLWIFGIALYIVSGSALAQDQNLPLKLINPLTVSPQAAAFTKYGDIPVSTNSGIPGISVPVYSISTGDITIPISLSYHASGVKVEDMASNAGLGWTLQACGNITRQVRGLPDEQGYSHANIDKFSNGQMTQQEIQTFYTGLRSASVDAEPDILYYSLPNGQSGKFFQARDGRYVTMPRSNLLINKDANGNWIVTDDNGIKYYFSVSEESHTVTWTSSNNSGFTDGPEFSGKTAWYVNKVIDSKGNQVNFFYNTRGTSYETKGSESKKILTSQWDYGNFTVPTELRSASYSVNSVVSNHLQKITWVNGTVNFSYDVLSRKDLLGDTALKSITVLNSIGTQVKKFNLYTSYFENSPSQYSSDVTLRYRLRLDSLKEAASNGVLNPPYVFSYSSIGLPDRLSDAQDHWGYYNGKNNFPSLVSYYQNVFNKPKKFGANREVDPAYTQANCLQQIKYPTGGTTSFEFENNTFHQLKPDTFYTYNTASFASISGNNAGGSPNQYYHEFTETFTITQAMVVLNGKARVLVLTQIMADNPNGYVLNILAGLYNQSGTQLFNLIDPLNDSIFLFISPGTYVLKGSIETEFAHIPVASLNVNLFSGNLNLPGYYTEYAGGLRVKKIVNNDGISTAGIKEFAYNKRGANYSSGSIGFVNRLPQYGITEIYHNRTLVTVGENQVNVYHDDVYQSYNATPNFPLLTSGGGYVTYSDVDVTERDLSGNSKGKTEYTYTSFDDRPDEIFTDFPFPPPCTYDWKRGLILNEKQYKSAGGSNYTLVSEKKSDYKFLEILNDTTRKVINGVKAASAEFYGYPSNNDLLNDALTVSVYRTAAEYFWLKTDTSILYDENAGVSNALISQSLYNYRTDPLQLISVQGKNSKGSEVSTGLKYPNDFSATIPYNLMVQNNQISPLIQQSDSINGSPVRAVQAVYASWGTGILLPQKLKEQILSNPLEDKVVFNAYDERGNILEQQKAGDVKEVFLWGYNFMYPVAKVVGSDFNTAKQYIDQNILNNAFNYSDAQIRTHLNNLRTNLPNSLVTTFTYSPLIGITSETDQKGLTTYYEYDNFSRLLRVRDNEGNIVKQFDYQYQALSHGNAIWVTTGVLRCKPCAANNAYITNIQQQEEKDTNPQSATYNQTRWTDAGTSSNCIITPDWQNTGTSTCLTDANGYRTGTQRTQQKDINPCSPTYNQTRNNDATNTTACPPNAPNWQNTTNTRCKPCPANGTYITNILQQEQRDNNTNSSTYNQLRWMDAGASSSCIVYPDWQNTTTPVRCKKDANNLNTGQQEQEQKDINPCSVDFGTIRWIVVGTNTTACPISCPNCSAINKKCINGVCETGVRVCIDFYYDSSRGQFVNTYHYEFSDGTWSSPVTEYEQCDCPQINCV